MLSRNDERNRLNWNQDDLPAGVISVLWNTITSGTVFIRVVAVTSSGVTQWFWPCFCKVPTVTALFPVLCEIPLVEFFRPLLCEIPLVEFFRPLLCEIPLMVEFFLPVLCEVPLVEFYRPLLCKIPLVEFMYLAHLRTLYPTLSSSCTLYLLACQVKVTVRVQFSNIIRL